MSGGTITTIAGNGVDGFAGDGGPASAAELNRDALGLALDTSSNLYFADRFNNRIRKLTLAAAATTTTLSASPNPSTPGRAVTLSASVSPPTATGTITFQDTFGDPTTNLGTVQLIGGQLPCSPVRSPWERIS